MPGISVNKIPIPFRKSGINWSSYWATLISATVENAAPTHVVLTFPTAQTSLGASDFTIAGFTVSSASWTGAVLTLVLLYPVTVYSGNLTITFVKTGGTAVVTNNVAMANTVGWYLLGDGSATYLTKDGSNNVSQWTDLSGSNNHLIQATALQQPVYSASLGVIFDGSNTAGKGDLLKSAAFTYNQPCHIYMVVRNRAYETNHGIADGNSNSYKLVQGSPDKICIYAGVASIAVAGLNDTDYYIIRALYSGASSKLIVNNGVPVTGNIGEAAWGGITIGARGIGNDPAQVTIKEAIFRNVADDAATETAIFNYLAYKHGFFLI